MNLLSLLKGAKNSLILPFDYKDFKGEEAFEKTLSEIGQYYSFDFLSTLVEQKKMGSAAVVFKAARKGTFNRMIPVLREKKIPYTIFVQVECMGLNRLPLEEELNLYATHYPEKMSPKEIAELYPQVGSNPSFINEQLLQYRKSKGPLPIEKTDPYLFFSTWGTLLGLSPKEAEFGWRISMEVSEKNKPLLLSEFNFMKTQIGKTPTLAYSSLPIPPDFLSSLGIQALVTSKEGLFEKKTSLMEIPCWNSEES